MREKRTEQMSAMVESRARHVAGSVQRAADLQLEVADASIHMAQDLCTKLVDELVGNAFKFSPAGSPVRVTAAPSNGRYVLSILDHGQGMDAGQIAAIGAYSQFNRSTREQQGSGLGLAIAKRIVELHGGSFSIQSTMDAGTTVSVTLPAS
jgi:two-component system, sensor histidine kinase and response regulator